MGRDMSEVEMAGREENLLGVGMGVGVVGRFSGSWVVAEAVSSQPTEADRPRLKSFVRFLLIFLLIFLLRWNMRFFEGVLGVEYCCSCSGEVPLLWTSVDVGLELIG